MIHNRRLRHLSSSAVMFLCLILAAQPNPTDGFQHSTTRAGRRRRGTNVPSIERQQQRRRRIFPSLPHSPIPTHNPTKQHPTTLHSTPTPPPHPPPPNIDTLIAEAGKLRLSIRTQQLELQKLETLITSHNSTDSPSSPQPLLPLPLLRPLQTLLSSTSVLLRKLQRVRSQTGPNNQRYNGSLTDYISSELNTIPRIVEGLVRNPKRVWYLVDPSTPTLIPHVPGILSRLDRLEDHVADILERVLNNSRHLASIEPYLSGVLERFDDIEPHLPWILENIDALAPYTGLLLRHIDELLLYADADEYQGNDGDTDRYALAAQLLPYLEYYVSRLDVIGPHLPLLRPHVPLLLRYNRIGKISPHIDRLFARGYRDLSASVNMDVLLWWFGWTLRIPGLPRLFFALPGSPRIVSFLANRMPRGVVRRGCADVECVVEGGYGGKWNKLD